MSGDRRSGVRPGAAALIAARPEPDLVAEQCAVRPLPTRSAQKRPIADAAHDADPFTSWSSIWRNQRPQVAEMAGGPGPFEPGCHRMAPGPSTSAPAGRLFQHLAGGLGGQHNRPAASDRGYRARRRRAQRNRADATPCSTSWRCSQIGAGQHALSPVAIEDDEILNSFSFNSNRSRTGKAISIVR